MPTAQSCIVFTTVGDIPLHIDIRETADSGKPIVVSQPDSPQVINLIIERFIFAFNINVS